MRGWREVPWPGVVHRVGERWWGSRRGRLWTSQDAGASWRPWGGALPGRAAWAARLPLAARLTRAGVHHLLEMDEGRILLAVAGCLCLCDPGGRLLATRPVRGSRPLHLAQAGGYVYYGDYGGNLEREPVHIWASRDGRRWEATHRFDGVRHVHGVFADPYRDCLWVTTGDEDHECAIWRADPAWSRVEPVLAGGQEARAVSLLCTEGHLYFGTDSPALVNHICRLDPATGRVERLQAVGGSVFWGRRAGGAMVFSTAVEPSPVNRDPRAVVWASRDGEAWLPLGAWAKDLLSPRLFGYGQVFFPAGAMPPGQLLATPYAVKGGGRTMLCNLDEALPL